MLLDYIRSHAKSFAAWIIICVIFAAVFALYDLPLGAVLYGALLSAFFGIVFAACGFYSYRKKRLVLKKLISEITYAAGGLPEETGVERDYAELVKVLYENLRSTENEMSAKYSDMTDYYTLWAHQIKTPIAAMKLVLQDGDSSDNAELLENLRKIEQYTEMALVFMRLGSDYTDYVIKEYDLDSIVRRAVRKFSPQFIRRKLKLTYEPLEKTVLTDEKSLLFVIEQVISNSVKYTRAGGVEIYLEEPLTLCIKDTGIGIAPEDLPRIFDKGYTGCNGRIDKKASGIGLYLCRRICNKLGHKITAESSENGTVIRIDLSAEKVVIE